MKNSDSQPRKLKRLLDLLRGLLGPILKCIGTTVPFLYKRKIIRDITRIRIVDGEASVDMISIVAEESRPVIGPSNVERKDEVEKRTCQLRLLKIPEHITKMRGTIEDERKEATSEVEILRPCKG